MSARILLFSSDGLLSLPIQPDSLIEVCVLLSPGFPFWLLFFQLVSILILVFSWEYMHDGLSDIQMLLLGLTFGFFPVLVFILTLVGRFSFLELLVDPPSCVE